MDKRKWRRFERLVFEIQKSLTPNSYVKHDYHVLGKMSEVERQIDIAVFDKIGSYEYFIAIDCKDYKKNLLM